MEHLDKTASWASRPASCVDGAEHIFISSDSTTDDIESIVSQCNVQVYLDISESELPGGGQGRIRNLEEIRIEAVPGSNPPRTGKLTIQELRIGGDLGPPTTTQNFKIEAHEFTKGAGPFITGHLKCGVRVVAYPGETDTTFDTLEVYTGDIETPVRNDYGAIPGMRAQNGSIIDTSSGASRFAARDGFGSIYAGQDVSNLRASNSLAR